MSKKYTDRIQSFVKQMEASPVVIDDDFIKQRSAMRLSPLRGEAGGLGFKHTNNDS